MERIDQHSDVRVPVPQWSEQIREMAIPSDEGGSLPAACGGRSEDLQAQPAAMIAQNRRDSPQSIDVKGDRATEGVTLPGHGLELRVDLGEDPGSGSEKAEDGCRPGISRQLPEIILELRRRSAPVHG